MIKVSNSQVIEIAKRLRRVGESLPTLPHWRPGVYLSTSPKASKIVVVGPRRSFMADQSEVFRRMIPEWIVSIEDVARLLEEAGITRVTDHPKKPKGPWFYVLGTKNPHSLNYGISSRKWDQLHINTPEYVKEYGIVSGEYVGSAMLFHGSFTDPGIKVERFTPRCSIIGESFDNTIYDGRKKGAAKRIANRILRLLRGK